MTELIIKTDNFSSRILIGEDYRNLGKFLPEGKKIFIIADANIIKYYNTFFQQWTVIEISACEKTKNLDTVAHIYKHLLENNADRNSFVVAVGGGVVCDVAGFAASTYMRGIPFGFVSTTLLSQVDASVGGKNGINFDGYKNMIGTFNQPCFVLCDISMLKTLPDREFISGFAEIVKAAVICNADLFGYLEQNAEKALARDPEVIKRLIVEAVKIKADVVKRDEREQNLRRILNFGHTFGHAVEAITGVSHGEAVSIGMMMEAQMSVAECDLPKSQVERLEKLLTRLGLPVATEAPPEAILRAMLKDKKRENDHIHFVLLKRTGDAVIKKMPVLNSESRFEQRSPQRS